MTDLHKHIPVNTKGRDFVVGDLHGCLSILETMLMHLEFDRTKDRLFSVGDLVDRGPDSLGCLRLLREPWFFSVIGNHESMLLEGMKACPNMDPIWLMNGGDWYYYALDPDGQFEVRDLCVQHAQFLPFVMTVDLPDAKKFHIVHAEFDDVTPISDFDLVSRLPLLMEECSFDGPFPLWGRKVFGNIYRAHLTEEAIDSYVRDMELHRATEHFGNLSTIYSGHTPMRQPTKIGPQINLDTCAYAASKGHEDAKLTITEPLTGRFWESTGGPVVETNLLVIV